MKTLKALNLITVTEVGFIAGLHELQVAVSNKLVTECMLE